MGKYAQEDLGSILDTKNLELPGRQPTLSS